MIKSNYKVVGVMSGTSLDGIDLIYANYLFDNQWNFEIHKVETVKYSQYWKSILGELTEKSLIELKVIDTDYTEYFANIILDFLKKNEIKNLDFIASHGHTALHQPKNKLTLQIGNLQSLADILGQKVICDFRVQDVQLGGQGAPLVPIGDQLLFHNYDYCLNLGGFANISFELNKERIAYDICPVNIVLNHYVSKLDLEYDDKGQIASKGTLNRKLLEDLNSLKFYNEKPPKSLGLEWVKLNIFPLVDPLNMKVEDILNTYIEHIAIQISTNIKDQNAEVLITGGGAYNDYLIERLKYYSKASIVVPKNEIVEFKEALIFGFLGVLKDRGEVNCLKSVTGAEQDHSSGKILFSKL